MEGAPKRYNEADSKADLLIALDILQHRVSQINSLEERCRRAETALKAMEERNLLWREAAPMGICTVDGQGEVTGINRKMREMLALPPAELGGRDGSSSIFESGIGDMLRRCLENRESIVFEQSQPGSLTGWERLRYQLTPVSDARGAVVGAMVFGENITELTQAQQAIRESEKRFRLLFQSAPIAMLEREACELKAHIAQLRASGVTDFRDYVEKNPGEVSRCMSMIKTLSFNAAFLNLMEVSDAVALRNGFGMAIFENAETLAKEVVLMMAEGGLTNEKERVFTTFKGNKKTVLAKTLVLTDPEATMCRIIVALVDISQRKEAEEALRISEQRFRDQALHDGLTGLYNRRYLFGSLEALIASSAADGCPLSVIFMDIDRFKEVVDTYGHLNGSRVIRELAATIASALETPAYAVAYAGDEFVVVLPGFSSARATQKAFDIQQLMKHAVYLRGQGAEVRLRASFGIATFPDHAKDMRGLLGAADQALFAVKQNGKNAIRRYGETAAPAVMPPGARPGMSVSSA